MPILYTTDISTLAGRLNVAMDAAGFDKVLPFAKLLGWPDSIIRGYLIGKTKNPGAEKLSKLAAILNVLERWLATGQGPMRPGEESLEFVQQVGRGTRWEDLPAAHRLTLETLEDIIQDMTEEQVLEFHRGLRDLARKVKREGA